MRTMLEFMEASPEKDFGSPGNMVHHMEGLPGQGYEEELLMSVQRTPVVHTVWMLNRLANGKDARWREEALRSLESVAQNDSVEPGVREAAGEFCQFQRKRAGK
ncbi:MAG TPA: hypothetical protein VGE39_05395 [Prosthecobacter sp.]